MSKQLLPLILALAMIRGLIYAAVIPPWQAPDEPPQFERVVASLNSADWYSTVQNQPTWYSDLKQALFTFDFYGFVDIPRRIYDPHQPLNHYLILYHEAYGGLYGSRLAYAMIGWPLLVWPQPNIIMQLYVIRLYTVLMGVAVILLAYLITQTIFPNNRFLGLGVPLLILFHPQHTHLLATVNIGNLAELWATLALYFMTIGLKRGFTWPISSATLFFSFIAIWTKATAYFLLFVLALIGLIYLLEQHQQLSRYWRWGLWAGIIFGGLMVFLVPERLILLIIEALISLKVKGLYLHPLVPLDLFRSFWAYPGWTVIILPAIWYQLLAVFCLLALIGLTIPGLTQRHLIFSPPHQTQIRTLLIFGVAIGTAIVILLSWNGVTHSTVYRQGRSIYPVIVPLSLFIMLGWQQLIPPNWRALALAMLTAIFFLFDSFVLFDYIIPFFYSRY